MQQKKIEETKKNIFYIDLIKVLSALVIILSLEKKNQEKNNYLCYIFLAVLKF